MVVTIDDLSFRGAANSGIWPKRDNERARVLALLALPDALNSEVNLRSEGREPVTIPLLSDAFDEPRTPAATNPEIREFVMLKAAWADRLGAPGCRFDADDAWHLGVGVDLIHNAEQLLIDDDFLVKEGALTRPTLKLVDRFENGQIGHAPPLLEALSDRLHTPRYKAAHEQVIKAVDRGENRQV